MTVVSPRAVVGSAVDLLATGKRGATATVHFGSAMASKFERAIDLHIATLEAAQPLIRALARAVDDGLVDDLRAGLRALDASATVVNRMEKQLEQTTSLLNGATANLRKTAAAADALASALPAAQLDIARLGAATDRVVAVLTGPVVGLDAVPGLKQARSALSAAAGLASSDVPRPPKRGK